MLDESIKTLNEIDPIIQTNLKQVKEINRREICYELKTRGICSH